MQQREQAKAAGGAADYETVIAIPAPNTLNGVWIDGLTFIAVADDMAYNYRLKPSEALKLAAGLIALAGGVMGAKEDDQLAAAAEAPDYETVVALRAPDTLNGVWVDGHAIIAVAAGIAYHYRLRPAEALRLASGLTANVAQDIGAEESRRDELAAAAPAGSA